MPAYIIGYDLNRPGQNYAGLFEAIKSLGLWWRCLDSTWIVVHPGPASTIRDTVLPQIDSNDRLLVAKLDGEAAWVGFNQDCRDWLEKNL